MRKFFRRFIPLDNLFSWIIGLLGFLIIVRKFTASIIHLPPWLFFGFPILLILVYYVLWAPSFRLRDYLKAHSTFEVIITFLRNFIVIPIFTFLIYHAFISTGFCFLSYYIAQQNRVQIKYCEIFRTSEEEDQTSIYFDFEGKTEHIPLRLSAEEKALLRGGLHTDLRLTLSIREGLFGSYYVEDGHIDDWF